MISVFVWINSYISVNLYGYKYFHKSSIFYINSNISENKTELNLERKRKKTRCFWIYHGHRTFTALRSRCIYKVTAQYWKISNWSLVTLCWFCRHSEEIYDHLISARKMGHRRYLAMYLQSIFFSVYKKHQGKKERDNVKERSFLHVRTLRACVSTTSIITAHGAFKRKQC